MKLRDPILARHPRGLGLAAVLIVYGICYARSLTFGLVWDDRVLGSAGLHNTALTRLLGMPQQALLDATALATLNAEVSFDSYRPLQTLSHVADMRWLGGSAFVMHAHNLALGLLAVWLAFVLLGQLGASPLLTTGCTAVFALHPLQTETLAYVSARGDLLAGVAALVAIVLALRSCQSPGALRSSICVGSGLAYLCSLCAKEAYAGTPLIICVLVLVRPRWRSALWAVAGQVLAMGVYAWLRAAAMGATSTKLGGGAFRALLQWPGIALQYARSFLLPLDLSISRPVDPSLVPWGWTAVAMLGLLALAIAYKPASRALLVPVVSSAVCVLVCLGPAAVAVASTGVTADRYAYLAVLPLAYLTAALGRAVPTRFHGVLWLPLGGWAVLGLVVQVHQVPTFRDNWRLYEHAAAMEPNSALAQYHLGFLEARAGDPGRARAHFERTIALDPSYAAAHNDLAVVLLQAGELEQAEAAARRAIALAPDLNYRAHYNLALIRARRGDKRGACEALRRSNAINRAYALATRMREALCVQERKDASAP